MLKDVISDEKRSLLSAAASHISSNIRLAAPMLYLRTLLAAIPSNSLEALTLEVKENVAELVAGFYHDDKRA